MWRAGKAATVQGGWRISQSTLHLLAFLGGWPGALMARHAFCTDDQAALPRDLLGQGCR